MCSGFDQLRIHFGHRIGLMALAQVSIPHRHSKVGMAHQSAYGRIDKFVSPVYGLNSPMPLFWSRPASTGSPPERYTLQIPFQLGATHALNTADVKDVAYGDLHLDIVENEGVQLFRVSGFKTADEAEAFLPRVRGALLRLIVVKKLSLRMASGVQKVKLNEPPIDVRGNPNFGDLFKIGWTHVDGFVDPSPVVAIPEHLRIMEVGAGSSSVKISMPVTSFLDYLAEGLSLPQSEQIAADERISLSIDLYAASLWETSQRARVISLATCLEALIEPERVVRAASEQIDRVLEVYDSARDLANENDEQRRALDRMRSRLSGLKEESISESLRRLAASRAAEIGEAVNDARRNMTDAYGVRSKLLHDGHAPSDEIASAAEWLGKAVPAILGSFVAHAAKPD